MTGKSLLVLTGLLMLGLGLAGCSTSRGQVSSAAQTQSLPPPNQMLSGVPASAGTQATVQAQGSGAVTAQRP